MPTKNIIFIITVIVLVIILVGVIIFSNKNKLNQTMNNLTLKSPVFEDKENISDKYTCEGENINPPLEIYNIPEGTKSLALVVDDPDATGGDTFDHWVIWNINPQISKIEEGKLPEGAVEGTNDFGNINYGGLCPPQGNNPHRYVFKLYALDKKIEINPGSSKKELEFAMDGHIIESTTLTGYYGR